MKVALNILFVVLLTLFVVSSVSAHAKLIKAIPAPGSSVGSAPSQVQLWFDEPPELGFSEVQVLNAQKERVDTGALTLSPDDPLSVIVPMKGVTDGTYTVVWKILSQADGHITRGVFAFNVGNVAGPATVPIDSGGTATYEANPISATARWLSLLSLLTLAGAFFFRVYLLNRSLDAVDANNSTRRVVDMRWLQLVAFAFILFFVGNLAELALQAQLVADEISFTALIKVLTTTRFGSLWLIRIGLIGAAGLIVILMQRRVRVPQGELALIVLGFVALFTRSLLGHSVGIGDRWLPVIADWLHLLGIAIWVGGLFVFAWVMPFIWRSMDPIKRSKWIAWLVPEFSFAAIASTIIIAGTGIYSSRVQIPALDKVIAGDFSAFQNLFANSYTASLTLKVGLFLVMIAFGALNLLLISPRFRGYVTAPEKSARLFSRFRLTVAGEVLLGVGVIFLAGLLTLTPPPRSTPTEIGPAVVEQIQERPVILFGNPTAEMRVQLQIGPTVRQPEVLEIRATDPQGNPLTDIQRVILQFMYLDQDQGLQNVNAESANDGTYIVNGNYFPLDGMWRVRVMVRRRGLADAVVDFPYYRSAGDASNNDVATARLQLQQAEARMNNLAALRSRQELNDGTNAVVVSEYEYRAPDKTRFKIEGQGEAIAIGSTQYLQTTGGQWNERPRIDAFVFPKFDFAQQARNVRFGREETIDGTPAQLIRFEIPTTSGDEMVQYAYWVAKEDARVLQFAMAAATHYMVERYGDFDSQGITISAPANVAPAPTSAPIVATQGNDAITQMVVASPRPRGPITGDLEGDGALVLVVSGVVLLLLGGGGKRPRNTRLTILGIGAASVLLGVGLFIDAVNGTINANASAPTNLARATPGQLVYQENCLACHGEKARGDGPGGQSLPVKPFDLTTHFFQHDEQYHFQTILNGRGYMPAFGPRLTQDQIVDVVAYVRLLAQQARQQGGSGAPGFTPQP
ncbi:MAG: copper resistance protein CopC [Anaerolineae bacterium]|nr:copper resistance protein CopC [Anaerolineae bacterium]